MFGNQPFGAVPFGGFETVVASDDLLIEFVMGAELQMAPKTRIRRLLDDGKSQKAFAAILNPWLLSDRV